MGRGDRRTKRGKIFAGTYGVQRERLSRVIKAKKDSAKKAAAEAKSAAK